MVLSSPARMIVNNTPSKTSTPLCPEESDVRIAHIARAATQCKKRLQLRKRVLACALRGDYCPDMKHTFFVFLVAAACVASALAQPSPAPSGSGSLTKEE